MPPSKLYLYSLSRSGSTLVWQVLHYLCPDTTISKRHTPPPAKNAPVIVVLRDPRDRVASLYRKQRTGTVPLTNKNWLVRLLQRNEQGFGELRQYLDSVPAEQPLLLLWYDQLYENFDYLLDTLAPFLGLTITDEQREHVKANFNVDSNLAVSQQLTHFQRIDYERMIHGNHISPLYKGAPLCWTKVIDPKLHKFLMKQLQQQLKYFQQLRIKT